MDQFNRSSGRSGLIVVLSGEYDLARCGRPDDTNRAGDLDALGQGALTVVGAGRVTLRQTCAGERILDDHGGAALTLANIEMTGGSATGTDPVVPVTGGAIRATGSVTLLAARLHDNRAVAPNGADATETTDPQAGGAARGGAIAAGGAVVAYASTLSANTAAGGRGGSGLGADDDKGKGGAAAGGAIAAAGPVRLTGTTFSADQALGGAGSKPRAEYSFGAGAAGGPARGGAVDADTIRVQHSRFRANAALGGDAVFVVFSMASVAYGRPGGAGDGGALAAVGPVAVSRSIFQANTATEGTGAPSAGSHGGALATAGSASISDSTLDANSAARREFSAYQSFGGAVSTGAGLTLSGDTFRNNQAENGGAVHAAGPLAASRVSFVGNQATKGGAAQTDSTATVSRSSFADNHVAVTVLSAGGGLYATGAVTVTQSSFTGNHLDHVSPFPSPLCHFGVCFFGDLGAHGGAIASAASISVTASRFAGNAVQGGVDPSPAPTIIFGTATGGALAAPVVVVSDSTLTDSRSLQEGADPTTGHLVVVPGHGAAIDGTSTTLRHVTLTDSSGLDAIYATNLLIGGTVLRGVTPTGGTECVPTVITTSEGHNSSDDASCHLGA